MKRSDKVSIVIMAIAAAVFYVSGNIAYNEENYIMLVNGNDLPNAYVIEEPGLHWVGWGVQTDRYKREINTEFTRDANTKTEDLTEVAK
jgi:hypothetical protein